MKRSYIYNAVVLQALLAGVFSCGKTAPAPSMDEGLSVRVLVDGMQTKTTSAGVDAMHENDVNTVSVFVFGSQSGLLYRADALPVDGSGHARSYIPGDLLQAASASGESLRYVVVANANIPQGTFSSEDEVFSSVVSAPSFADGGVQDALPFFGTGTATLSNAGRLLSGTVTLKRSAAKLEVRVIELATDVEDDRITYIPDTDHMQVVLTNGVKSSAIGGISHLGGALPSSAFFSVTAGPLVERGTGSTYYTTEVPFYSLASDWSGDDSAEASFLLIVPWSSDGGSTWKRSYYQIPVNAVGMRMQENTHYIVNMRIGIVGSFEEVAPVTLTPSVVTVPWGAFDMEDNEIKESRYLVLENTSLTLDNRPDATVRFSSSHDCVIYSKSLTRADLSSASAPTQTIPESQYTLTIPEGRSEVQFHHELDNSGGASADFAPYTLTFVIGHADNANYTQTVTIVQQPMIYVIAQLNSDGDSNSHKGYVYLNGSQSTSNYGGVHGLAGSNTNPSMYVISLSSFTAGSTYTIGDPRLPYVDNLPSYSGANLTYTWATSATSIQGGSRRLSYYHPAEQGDRTKDMVAPKFRVASSYGVTTTQSYRNMQMRCASYQEDGYPAGRWRLPTAAEVMYIISLSEQGTIPELFTISASGNGYWCANGYINGNSSGVATFYENDYSGTHSVRCVYDDWFWGSEPAVSKTTFTWGDTDY